MGNIQHDSWRSGRFSLWSLSMNKFSHAELQTPAGRDTIRTTKEPHEVKDFHWTLGNVSILETASSGHLRNCSFFFFATPVTLLVYQSLTSSLILWLISVTQLSSSEQKFHHNITKKTSIGYLAERKIKIKKEAIFVTDNSKNYIFQHQCKHFNVINCKHFRPGSDLFWLQYSSWLCATTPRLFPSSHWTPTV